MFELVREQIIYDPNRRRRARRLRHDNTPQMAMIYQVLHDVVLVEITALRGRPVTKQEHIHLSSIPSSVGRRSYYLHCPRCDRRARYLYLPPHADHIACYACHNLTYMSRSETPRQRRWRKLLNSNKDAWRTVASEKIKLPRR